MVGGIVPAAVGPRRHDGCSECKRKKAKCDLKTPVCSRCSRFPNFCKYEDFVQCLSSSQTVADQIHELREEIRSHQPTQPVSRYLVNPRSKFFIHHFGTQTVTLLFPLVPGTFTSQLISTALHSPCLLFALLAASSSHYSRLTSDPTMQRTTLAYTNIAISSLRQALTTHSVVHIDHVATAIALCTNDICNGTKDSYRSHLAGARRLLEILRMSQPRDLDTSFLHGLTRWFSIPDVSASASGSRTSIGPDEKHPVLDLIQRPSKVQVDDFCGHSLELMPLILSKSRNLIVNLADGDGGVMPTSCKCLYNALAWRCDPTKPDACQAISLRHGSCCIALFTSERDDRGRYFFDRVKQRAVHFITVDCDIVLTSDVDKILQCLTRLHRASWVLRVAV